MILFGTKLNLHFYFLILSKKHEGYVCTIPWGSTGQIQSKKSIPLDHEAINLFHLTLKATNQDTKKSTEVEVRIYILDDNDNKPIFHNRWGIVTWLVDFYLMV